MNLTVGTKLYSISDWTETPELVEGTITRESAQYIWLDNSRVSGWSKRVAKFDITEGRNRFGVHESPAAAWSAYAKRQDRIIEKAKQQIEDAQAHRDLANDALQALYDELRGAEVK